MEVFTPVLSMIGGVLIGFAAIALLYFNGRIAGISGIMGGVLRPQQGDSLWRAVFLAGLLTGAALILLLHPTAMDLRFDVSDSTIILGGFLVGAGLFRIGWGPGRALSRPGHDRAGERPSRGFDLLHCDGDWHVRPSHGGAVRRESDTDWEHERWMI